MNFFEKLTPKKVRDKNPEPTDKPNNIIDASGRFQAVREPVQFQYELDHPEEFIDLSIGGTRENFEEYIAKQKKESLMAKFKKLNKQEMILKDRIEALTEKKISKLADDTAKELEQEQLSNELNYIKRQLKEITYRKNIIKRKLTNQK